MTLMQPKDGGYAGGHIELQFDSQVTISAITINDAVFHADQDEDQESDIFTLNVNGFPPNLALRIAITSTASGGMPITDTVTIYKPRDDLGGMGATVIRVNGDIDGVFFKFWLPQVAAVNVRGDFNDWTDANCLDQLGDSGYWFGYSRQARAGQSYRFFVYGSDGNAQEVSDPAARQTLKTPYNDSTSDNDANAVIIDAAAFVWQHDNDLLTSRRDHRKYVIYEVHWGTFLSMTAANAPYETFVGGATDDAAKRQNVEARLQYIVDLGFTAIELLPVHEANGSRDAGYDPSFLFSVESAYGTPDDLRILVDVAHGLGLAVLFDAVVNHQTNDPTHASFAQDFIKGWYIRDNAPWSNNAQWGGSPWGYFPDWNRPEIRNLLTDCILMYLHEFHVDGIRFDATTTIPTDALQYLIGQVRQDPNGHTAYLVAEHLTDDPLPYVVGQEGFSAGWYKPAFDVALGNLIGRPGKGDLGVLRQIFETDYQGEPTSAVKYLLGSHDEWWKEHAGCSIVGRLGGAGNDYARMKVRLGWSLSVLSLGTPMLFMGSETMTDLGWSNDAGYDGLNWENPGPLGVSFTALIKGLNRLRVDNEALRSGNANSQIVHWDADNSVAAYRLWDSSGGVFLVVANFSDSNWQSRQYQVNTGLPGSTWHECFNSQFVLFGGWTGADNSDSTFNPHADGTGLLQGINVAKWSLLILKLL